MPRVRAQRSALVLVAAATLACGAAPPSEPMVVAAPVADTPAAPPPVAAPDEPSAAGAAADSPASPVVAQVEPPAAARAARRQPRKPAPIEEIASVPLEKLLEVPPWATSKPPEPDINEVLRLELPPEPVVATVDEQTGARVLHLDVNARTDAPIERRDWKRDQLDAGAKVDISKDTSIRGGVRIERETSGTKEPVIGTTPSIGIERRF